MKIKHVFDENSKKQISQGILRSLHKWFGIEETLLEYVKESAKMPFWTILEDEQPVGFVALKVHNSFTSEVYVMGVLQEHHRKGFGRQLIECCYQHCIEN